MPFLEYLADFLTLRRLGLRQRMIVVLGIFLLVLMAFIATWEAQRERDLITRQMQSDGLALAKAYALSAENALLLRGAGLARVSGEAGRTAGIRYMAIMNEYCRVIAHTDSAYLGTFRRDAQIVQALQTPIGAVEAGRTTTVSQEITTPGAELYRVLVPLVILEQVKGVLEVGLETDLIRNLTFNTSREVAMIAFFAYLVGIMVVVTFTRSLTRPVLDLARAATRIAGGDLEAPIQTRAQGEIGLLAESLEKMRGELNDSFGQLRNHAFEIEHVKTFFEMVLNTINPGVITLDEQGLVIGVNRSSQMMLGLGPQDLMGRYYAVIFAAWPELAGTIAEFVLGETDSREVVLTFGEHDPSQRLVRFQANEMRDKEGLFIGNVIELDDISLLRSMERRVHESEKMAVMGELAAGVAHEVRNPLGSIRNAAQFLEGKLPTGEAIARFPGLIMGEVDRLNNLVTRLLQFTRREGEGFGLLDIRESIDNAVALAELKLAGSRIRIDCRFESRLPLVYADARRLVQVFVNILFNAIEAISAQGLIEVAAVSGAVAGRQGVCVTVRDSGGGVAPEDLGRIFEPFFTTREGGTGLGLSIVRQIVQEHNGTISADSRPGDGTCITIFFPVCEGGSAE